MWLDEVSKAAPLSGVHSIWKLMSVLIALASALAGPFMNWLKERDSRVRRSKELDDATKIASFWQVALGAARDLNISPNDGFHERAKGQLSYVSQYLDQLIDSHRQEQRTPVLAREFIARRDALPRWRRSFLVYLPGRKSAWFVRVLFYLVLLSMFSVPYGEYGTWHEVHQLEVERQKLIQEREEWRKVPLDKGLGVFADTPENRQRFQQYLEQNTHFAYDGDINRNKDDIHDARRFAIFNGLSDIVQTALCFVLPWLSRRLEVPRDKMLVASS